MAPPSSMVMRAHEAIDHKEIGADSETTAERDFSPERTVGIDLLAKVVAAFKATGLEVSGQERIAVTGPEAIVAKDGRASNRGKTGLKERAVGPAASEAVAQEVSNQERTVAIGLKAFDREMIVKTDRNARIAAVDPAASEEIGQEAFSLERTGVTVRKGSGPETIAMSAEGGLEVSGVAVRMAFVPTMTAATGHHAERTGKRAGQKASALATIAHPEKAVLESAPSTVPAPSVRSSRVTGPRVATSTESQSPTAPSGPRRRRRLHPRSSVRLTPVLRSQRRSGIRRVKRTSMQVVECASPLLPLDTCQLDNSTTCRLTGVSAPFSLTWGDP